MRKSAIAAIPVLIALVFGSRLIHTPAGKIDLAAASPASAPDAGGVVLSARTKAGGCQVNGPLQDPACTPGAIIAAATTAEICTPGYAKSVRDVPPEEKSQVYDEYGIMSHTPGEYEVDHLVSLELGGSNDISNLWPEAADPTPGFHQKDEVENYLHDQVCSGAISLTTAQHEIATNWLTVYQTLGH